MVNLKESSNLLEIFTSFLFHFFHMPSLVLGDLSTFGFNNVWKIKVSRYYSFFSPTGKAVPHLADSKWLGYGFSLCDPTGIWVQASGPRALLGSLHRPASYCMSLLYSHSTRNIMPPDPAPRTLSWCFSSFIACIFIEYLLCAWLSCTHFFSKGSLNFC